MSAEPSAPRGRAAAAANAINRLHRDYYGRGGRSARTVIQRNFVVVFLDDIYTPVERTLIEDGKSDTVRRTRADFQLTMTGRFSAAIEKIMGRKVVAFMSQVHFDPDMAVEIFVLTPEGSEEASDVTDEHPVD
jgi:uncharacterized protein YbcI